MQKDRVNGLMSAYFTKPYVEYGDVVLQIRENGGLTSEEVQVIKKNVLNVDANAMIRHTGSSEE